MGPTKAALLLVSLIAFGVTPLLGGGQLGRPVRAQATPVVAAEPESQYTPLVASVFAPPKWFWGSDGLVHLVYEVLLTNVTAVDVVVTELVVLDGGTGAAIATLNGDGLLAATSLINLGAPPTTTIPPSGLGVVWAELAFADAAELPTTISHQLTVAVPPGLPVPESTTNVTASAAVDLRPPVVLGAPLAGDQWVAVGSCCDGVHRRALQPVNGGLYLAQRFAIDFNKLDADGRFSTGDPQLNTSYPTYGQPVLAVANATVRLAVDQYEDQVAGETTGITLTNADGNYVILDLGDGRFAFYAHLKPGSVLVETGDTVERGQPIGEAGNTGSSDGPHLHFHVQDSPHVLAGDGLPYVFADYEVAGRIPPLSETLQYYVAQEPVPIDTATAGARLDELPLGGDVVIFPELATP